MKRFFCPLFFTLSSCLLSPTVTVSLCLPPLPSSFQSTESVEGPPPFKLIWESQPGVFETKEILYEQRISVEIWKGEGALVWVIPPYGLRPYGGFFQGQPEIQLTWSGGFLAETLAPLNFSQRKGINLPLLENQIQGNPWLTNKANLINALETKTLNRYSLKRQSLYPIRLEKIPSGIWINRYPNDFIKVEDDNIFQGEFPLGYERFYNLEKNLLLSLYVQETESTPFILKEAEW